MRCLQWRELINPTVLAAEIWKSYSDGCLRGDDAMVGFREVLYHFDTRAVDPVDCFTAKWDGFIQCSDAHHMLPCKRI